ncbi:MAG: hypothetical protein U1A78_11490 [Polyangia bacterium]
MTAQLGCAGGVARAPFPARPDTVVPGSLNGPFDGVVLDQSTNEPVAGALVLASWAFEDAQGLLTPSASYSTSVITEVDGSYRLPLLPRAQSRPSALLRRFTLVIYKAGYLGYRSDLRTDDRTPRHDFAQRGNVVRLDRFPQGESHARHLVFLGAGELLQRAAQAEGKQAALELTEASPAMKDKEPVEETPPEAPPPPLAARLLEAADVAPLFAQAGLSGEPSLVPLEAPPPPLDPGASGVRYTVVDKNGEASEGAAPGPAVDLRLWRLESGSEARALFELFKNPPRPAAAPAGKPAPNAPSPSAAPARPTAVQVAPPAGRAAAPPFAEVPAARTVLRDATGAAFPLPAAPAPAASPASSGAPARPLIIDGGLRAYDGAAKTRELSVLVKQLGLVLQVRCSEALCRDDAATESVLKRALSRL